MMPAVPAQTLDGFVDNGDGTVTDSRTGLMWMRCALGQSWAVDTCTGEAKYFTWDEAMALRYRFAGYDDWRLPDLFELKSIVKTGRHYPAIDTAVFPGMPSSYFWSGSTAYDYSGFAFAVEFSHGSAGSNNGGANYHVRLVRGGQSFNPLRSGGDNGTAGNPLASHATEVAADLADLKALKGECREALIRKWAALPVLEAARVASAHFPPAVRGETMAARQARSRLVKNLARTLSKAFPQYAFYSRKSGRRYWFEPEFLGCKPETAALFRRLKPVLAEGLDLAAFAAKYEGVAPVPLGSNEASQLCRSDQGMSPPENETAATGTSPQTLLQVVEWMATQETALLSELRQRLLPLDLLPGAVIADLNEQALDLTGDMAIEEKGEKIIIVREVLQIVSAGLRG